MRVETRGELFNLLMAVTSERHGSLCEAVSAVRVVELAWHRGAAVRREIQAARERGVGVGAFGVVTVQLRLRLDVVAFAHVGRGVLLAVDFYEPQRWSALGRPEDWQHVHRWSLSDATLSKHGALPGPQGAQ